MSTYPATVQTAIEKFRAWSSTDLTQKFHKFPKTQFGHTIYGIESIVGKHLSFFVDLNTPFTVGSKLVLDIDTHSLKILSRHCISSIGTIYAATQFDTKYPIAVATHFGEKISKKNYIVKYAITDHHPKIADRLTEDQKWNVARDITEAFCYLEHKNNAFPIFDSDHILIDNDRALLWSFTRLSLKELSHQSFRNYLYSLFVGSPANICYKSKKKELAKPIDRLILELFNPLSIPLSLFRERFERLFILRNRETATLTEEDLATIFLSRPLKAAVDTARESYNDDLNRCPPRHCIGSVRIDGSSYATTSVSLGEGHFKKVSVVVDVETGALKALSKSERRDDIDPSLSSKCLAVPFKSEMFGDLSYTITELFDHHDLSMLMNWDSVLITSDKLQLASDMAKSVLYLHKLDFVHQDIKPSNFFVHTHGGRIRAKLGDFSFLAKSAMASDVGNVGYSSPNKLMGEMGYPKQNDTFGLGVIFYELFIDPTTFPSLYAQFLKKRSQIKLTCYAEACMDLFNGSFSDPLHRLISTLLFPYHHFPNSLSDFSDELKRLHPELVDY